jgi:hypothetical protein
MKKRSFWLVLPVIVLAFGMTVVGCDNGDGGGTAFDGTWTNDEGMNLVAAGGTFIVSMDDGTPAFRGTYTVSGNNVAITFTGINTASGWTNYPENGGQDLPPKNITGTIKGNQFTIEGSEDMTFTKKGGSSGGSNTPSGNNSTFILTRPRNDHIGKYAMFIAETGNGNQIIGAQNINASGTSATLVKITGGSVSLPMWIMQGTSITKYQGNDNVVGCIMIFDSANVSEGTEPIAEKYYTFTFSNGYATKTWDEGQDQNPNGGGSDKPGEPGEPGKPGKPENQGTFTLINIPNDFNGKYAVLFVEDDNVLLIGAKSVNVSASGMSGTLEKISNGKVSLPMWKITQDASPIKYSGNDTVEGRIIIFNSENVSDGDEPIDGRDFNSIAFSEGNASIKWSDGKDIDNGGGDGGDPVNPPGGGDGGGDSDISQLYGTWIKDDNATQILTFNSDGTMLGYEDDTLTMKGTFKVKDNNITLNYASSPDKPEINLQGIYSIDGPTLTIEITGGGYLTTMTYTRQK